MLPSYVELISSPQPAASIPSTGNFLKMADAERKPPFPPFTLETAKQKVRAAEDGWNSQNPARVSLAYTPSTKWRNRSQFINGREEVKTFLTRKWAKELEYRLIKELWAHDGNRIAVRFCYEYRNAAGDWFRAHGNENWQFDANGLMEERHASINDVLIAEGDRLFTWPSGEARPADFPGLSELGL